MESYRTKQETMGGLALITSQALAVLASTRQESGIRIAELGQKGDAAHLRLVADENSARWAVVSSPGDRWFSLEVNGGFSFDYFEEETPDDEAQLRIERLVRLAMRYLSDDTVATKKGLFGSLVVRISDPDGDVILHRSLAGALKIALGIGRSSQ